MGNPDGGKLLRALAAHWLTKFRDRFQNGILSFDLRHHRVHTRHRPRLGFRPGLNRPGPRIRRIETDPAVLVRFAARSSGTVVQGFHDVCILSRSPPKRRANLERGLDWNWASSGGTDTDAPACRVIDRLPHIANDFSAVKAFKIAACFLDSRIASHKGFQPTIG